MAEDKRRISTSAHFVSIPDAHFDEIWEAMPENLKKSLLANPHAIVSQRDGTTTSLRDFVAMKSAQK